MVQLQLSSGDSGDEEESDHAYDPHKDIQQRTSDWMRERTLSARGTLDFFTSRLSETLDKY